MNDPANKATEDLIKEMEKKITAEYAQAVKESKETYDDYMKRFATKDKIKREAYEAGVISKKDYLEWRKSQLFVGDHLNKLAEIIAEEYVNASKTAMDIANDYKPVIYAENHNFATYVIEQTADVDLSYTLYNKETVQRLWGKSPKLLPDMNPKGKTAQDIAEGKLLRWNTQKVTSALSQGILQGDSIPDIAKRISSVAQMDHNASIRNARTMATGAQNAGRMDAARRAKKKGIDSVNVWAATLDMRTRHEHRMLDGKKREIDEPFEVEGEKIRFPGDPEAKPWLVYNCRCTLIPQVKGFEYDIHSDPNLDLSYIEGMSYDQWQKSKIEQPNKITLPEEKAAAIKGSYINEYKNIVKETKKKKGK